MIDPEQLQTELEEHGEDIQELIQLSQAQSLGIQEALTELDKLKKDIAEDGSVESAET